MILNGAMIRQFDALKNFALLIYVHHFDVMQVLDIPYITLPRIKIQGFHLNSLLQLPSSILSLYKG